MSRHLPLVFLTATLLFGAGCSKTTSVELNGTLADQTASQEAGQNLPLTFTSSTYVEHGALFDIKLSYPVAHDGAPALNDKVTTAVGEYVATTTNIFKESIKDAEQWYSGAKYGLEGEYDIPLQNDRFVSIMFNGYMFTGGAHGMQIYQTMVFDTLNAKKLVFSDVFDGNKYTNELSAAFRKKINGLETLEMSDADWIKSGTEAKPENFQYWYLAKDGFHVIFPPYQIAAYAAGSFDLAVPYSELPSLKPDVANALK